MKKRIVLGIVVSLLMVLVAGCGGASQPSEPAESKDNNNTVTKEEQSKEPVDLVLKDSHYKIEDGYVFYTIAVENPNTGFMPMFANIKITGRKADGSIAFSDDWTISSLAPQSTTYWASQAGHGDVTEEDTIELSISVDKDNWQKSSPKPADLYVFDNVSVIPESYGGLRVTGEITLTDETVDYGINGVTEPMLVCVFKDADGNLVGGFSSYVDSDLTEGTPSVFDIGCYHEIGDYVTAEMYANPWL